MKCLTKTLVLFLIIITSSVCIAQDFWEEIDFPFGDHIYDIGIDDDIGIWISGYNDIYCTYDFGAVWEIGGLNRAIRSIGVDSNIIYAGSNNSQYWSGLWRTENSGITWDSILPDNGVYGNVVYVLPLNETIFTSVFMSAPRLLRSTDYGLNWELVYSSTNSNEFISDIVVNSQGTMYFGLSAQFDNMGGIYKSYNDGLTWEYCGLLNYNIRSLWVNEDDDLFAGSSAGLFVLKNGEDNWNSLLSGVSVTDIAINTENHIYFTSSWPGGVYRSLDNGQTFEPINEGLPQGTPKNITLDKNGYLYLTSNVFVAKSINTTVSIPNSFELSQNGIAEIYPNPAYSELYLDVINPNFIGHEISIQIIDICGDILHQSSFTIEKKQEHLNLDILSAGLYIIRFQLQEKVQQTKLVKY